MEESKQTAWKGKTRGGAFGYLFFILLIKKAGIHLAYAFLCLVVVYFIPFSPRSTLAVWRYGRRVLGYSRLQTVRLLWVNYYRLGQVLIDKVAIGCGKQHKYHFRFEHYREFLDVLNAPGGVVMIGAHIGNWEVGAPFFDDYGKKMNIVMYDAEYRKIKAILERNMQERNYKVIPVNEDNLTHVFNINDALHRNEYVCFQGDRFVKGAPCLRISFLGREAAFPAGPFVLASRLDVPVVFYFAMREKGRTYRFHFFLAGKVKRSKEKKKEVALLEQYVDRLEEIVKKYPEQWFNYYDFWNADNH